MVGARLLTRHSFRLKSLLLAVATLALACRRYDTESALARAEKNVLERQIAGLRDVVALAEKGPLLPKDAIAVAVDEALVRDLIAVSLPLEQIVAERYKVRIERAEVSFVSQESVVRLHGRVSSLTAPETFVDLMLLGGIDTLEVDAQSGRLRGAVVLDHFEVRRASAAGAESRTVAALVEELGRERLEAFKTLVPRIEIPVRLDQRLVLKGPGDGPVSVRAGELPLHVAVARVLPVAGRLWVLLDVSIGAWKPVADSRSAR